MDLSTITKEQRQYAVLGALVAAIVIYVVFAFGLRPFLAGWEETQEENAELQQSLDDGRRSVNRTSRLLHNLDSTYTNLAFLADAYIAPNENAYSWVTEQIYRHARDLNFDVETISEYPPNLPWNASPSVNREFSAYGVRMVTSCGYKKLRQLIVKFEESNPLLVVSGITISPSTGDYERHRVQVLLEWPIWTSPEEKGMIRSSDVAVREASSS